MPIVADASAAVRADLSPFKRDLQGLNKPVKSFGDNLNAALSPKTLLLGAGGAVALAGITSFLGDAVSAASDLNETTSKSAQIFGEEAMPALEAWSATAADTFGQSQQQALDAASSFAIFGKSAGLAGGDLVDFGENLTKLASDFASFYNTSPEDAIVAIQAALRGESEPIRKYGVLLDDATLRQRALKLGIVDTTKNALTPQQRVLAAQAEIFAQTSDAQGDFARTSDGLANSQRTLEAKMEDLEAHIGQALLPVLTAVVQGLSDIIDAAGGAGAALGGLNDDVNNFFKFDVGGATGGTGPDDWLRAFFDSAVAVHDWRESVLNDQQAVEDATVRVTGQMTSEMERGLREGAGVLTEGRQQWSTAILQSDKSIAVAAREAAGGIPTSFKAAIKEAKDIAAALPSDIASAILAGKKDLKPIRKMIRDILAGSVADGVALGQNAAALMNPGIADALTGNSKEAKDAMLNEVVEPLIESILTLEPTALEAGAKVPKNIKQALDTNGPLAVQAMRDLMGDQNATLGQLAAFARARGLEGIAALIEAMKEKKQDAKDAAGDVATAAGNALDFSPKARAAGQAVINSYMNAMEETIGRRVTGFENKVDDILNVLLMSGSPPLTHSKEAGKLVASSYLDAMQRGLSGGLGDVSGMLNASLLPAWASPQGGMAAPASSPTYNVSTGSVPKEKTTLEIAYELRRAEYLGVLPR